MKIIKSIYSKNFDKIVRSPRQIIYIVFHYTGMKNENKAIARLRDKNSKVSCHYFIRKNGAIINMVPDKFTAWHAGISCWKKHNNLNDKSIGVEIQNPGESNNYLKFSKQQIKSTLYLSKILKKKYDIKSKNFLGHSDISPDRKKDPGEKFPWEYLAKYRIGIWYNLPQNVIKLRNVNVSNSDKRLFHFYLKKIGFCFKKKTKNSKVTIKAFQRRYRSKIINGKIDKECLEIAKNLIKRGLN
ncbi:MAG: hypothetical protein CBC25_00270 [Pelagibacteraceae bacterium TMED65]|mgnify:CR=1 FL=1|nr:MAG: hypothetical protein CBC25_00270 [Pelagibacteraceae bacterium TMED65]|tara:strand:+ start:1729 stop:2454 length:726 start_codon:yes stop_codon:yes gene_type:complete